MYRVPPIITVWSSVRSSPEPGHEENGGEKVDDFPFALVTPLRSHNRQIPHGTPRRRGFGRGPNRGSIPRPRKNTGIIPACDPTGPRRQPMAISTSRCGTGCAAVKDVRRARRARLCGCGLRGVSWTGPPRAGRPPMASTRGSDIWAMVRASLRRTCVACKSTWSAPTPRVGPRRSPHRPGFAIAPRQCVGPGAQRGPSGGGAETSFPCWRRMFCPSFRSWGRWGPAETWPRWLMWLLRSSAKGRRLWQPHSPRFPGPEKAGITPLTLKPRRGWRW